MRILYGVQGTGNGHITRARVMSQALKKQNVDVDYLFSGRHENAYFDMQCFKNKRYFRGLTFEIVDGEIKYFKTVLKNNLRQFYQDIKSCQLANYDSVICDFEPITAWAAKQQKVATVGIGHQYVFDYAVPQKKTNLISHNVLNKFAPTNRIIPLHWHHFNAPILPPIIEMHDHDIPQDDGLVLVYLPFENQAKVALILSQINSHQFIVYCTKKPSLWAANIEFKALSRSGFQSDLQRCGSVIANAGFELSSEAINLGKHLLVRPLKGQTEQVSNAMALKALNYGHVMEIISVDDIKQFLQCEQRVKVNFPDVATHIAKWIKEGSPKRNPHWFSDLWQQTEVFRS